MILIDVIPDYQRRSWRGLHLIQSSCRGQLSLFSNISGIVGYYDSEHNILVINYQSFSMVILQTYLIIESLMFECCIL